MKADINVTPLVDIVLVLLIIFIVITPAVSNAVQLPLARHGIHPERNPDARPLTLVLAARRGPAGTGAGPVLVEGPEGKDARGQALAFDLTLESGRRSLMAFLQGEQGTRTGRQVFIKADLSLPFKAVNELMQLCREAGVDEVSAVTREDQGRKDGGRHG